MNGKKKALLLSIVALMMLLVAPATVSAAVKSVQITAPTKKATYTAYRTSKKDTLQMKVQVKTTGKSKKTVTYKSSKPSVVSVSSKGKLTIKKNGTATITVTSKSNKKKSDKIKIKVVTGTTKVKISSISGATKSGSGYKLVTGKTATVKATATPKSAKNKSLSYKSSNTSIATINSSGKITAKKPGTVTITAQTKTYTKVKKATVKLTVTPPAITGVTFNAGAVLLSEGESRNLSNMVGKVSPAYASYSVSCSSANSKIVSASGTTVKGVSEGNTEVTIKVTDKTNNKSWSKKIRVDVEMSKSNFTKVSMTKDFNRTYSGITVEWGANDFVEQLNGMIAKSNMVRKNEKLATVKVTENGKPATITVGTDNDKKIQILKDNVDVTAKASAAYKVTFNDLTVAISKASAERLIVIASLMDDAKTNLNLKINATVSGVPVNVGISNISFKQDGYSAVTVSVDGKPETFQARIDGTDILIKGNVESHLFIEKLEATGSFVAQYYR